MLLLSIVRHDMRIDKLHVAWHPCLRLRCWLINIYFIFFGQKLSLMRKEEKLLKIISGDLVGFETLIEHPLVKVIAKGT